MNPSDSRTPLIARVEAGALIKDVGVKSSLNWLLTSGVAGLVAGFIRRRNGGIWIGGFADLRSDTFKFDPNEANEATASGTLHVTIPLDTIESVSWRPGMRLGIIDMVSSDEAIGTFSFRVENRDAVIAMINKARADLKAMKPTTT